MFFFSEIPISKSLTVFCLYFLLDSIFWDISVIFFFFSSFFFTSVVLNFQESFCCCCFNLVSAESWAWDKGLLMVTYLRSHPRDKRYGLGGENVKEEKTIQGCLSNLSTAWDNWCLILCSLLRRFIKWVSELFTQGAKSRSISSIPLWSRANLRDLEFPVLPGCIYMIAKKTGVQ